MPTSRPCRPTHGPDPTRPFEGSYWVSLWQFLWSSIVLVILLTRGCRQDFVTPLRDHQGSVVAAGHLRAGFLLITSVLGFPLSLFTDFWREHQYGLATQTFAAWFGDQLKGLASAWCWAR